MQSTLSIQNLHIAVRSGGGVYEAVRGLSLDIAPGEVVAVVGESGSGKSLTALSILGLLPRGIANVTQGQLLFGGKDLAKASPSGLDSVRGSDIGMVFQEPLSALNPVVRIGAQMTEGVRIRRGLSAKDAQAMALAALKKVRISDPERRLQQYPHELSGGMRQRVVIAMALISSPKLLIADEPTTALDVTIQAQIIALLKDLQASEGLAMMLITHDLGIVAQIANRVFVMYAGEIVESGSVETILGAPRHPYTKGLLSCVPELSFDSRRLNVIPGTMPAISAPMFGCRFKTRCDLYRPGACDAPVALRPIAPDHDFRCTQPFAGADAYDVKAAHASAV